MANMPQKDQLIGDVTAGEFKKGLSMMYDCISEMNSTDVVDKLAQRVTTLEGKKVDLKGYAKESYVTEALRNYYTMSETYGKSEVYTKRDTYSKNEVDSKISTQVEAIKSEMLNNNKIDETVKGLFTGNHAENGWEKLPSGLIIQWGKIEQIESNKEKTIKYPINFNKTFALHVNPVYSKGEYRNIILVRVNRENFIFKVSSYVESANWIAIGI